MHKRGTFLKHPGQHISQRMTPTASLYSTALQYHSAGQLGEAEKCYRKILAIDPHHADSMHLLGVIGHQAGHNQAAEAMIRKAIGLNSKVADYHCNLGRVLEVLGKLNEAIASYQNALVLDPFHPKAHNNLGNALLSLGRTEEAIEHYAQVLNLCPADADAQNNLGNALQAAGNPKEAIACYEKALAINGNHYQACFNLGYVFQVLGQLDDAMAFYRQALSIHPNYATAHNNLGNVLQALERPDEAFTCYQRAISLQPDYAEAYNNLGNVLRQQEKLEAALACYVRALKLKPDYLNAAIQCSDTLREIGKLHEAAEMFKQVIGVAPDRADVHRNYGETLRQLGRLTEAAEHCQQAISINPSDPDAYLNLGNALYDTESIGEAISCYEKALSLRPEHAISNFNLAVARLKSGDFSSGWKGYEWRWAIKEAETHKRSFPQPLWQGEPLQGKRILLYGEQGFGDSIQFLRYAPMVQAAGGKVILEVPRGLERLAQLPGIEGPFGFGDSLPTFDWQCPLMTLPLALGTDLNTIPASVPYFNVPSDAFQKAKAYPWPAEGLRVGLVWAGNPKHLNNRFRSIPFSLFQPIFNIKSLNLFSLQIGEPLKELTQSEAPVIDLAPHISNLTDTAAIIANLDLVITVDTGLAHLAGALAKPVWILLPANAEWRWLMEREDSPWYPTARLFRQEKLDDWNNVMERVASSLIDFSLSSAKP